MKIAARASHPSSPLFNRQAQSLVEFALTLPFLLLFLLGAVDLGRLFHVYVTITNASREGARYGIVKPTDASGIQDHAIQEASLSGVSLTSSDITLGCFSFDGSSSVGCDVAYNGDRLQVTVTQDFQLLSLLGRGTLHLSSFTIMPIVDGVIPPS